MRIIRYFGYGFCLIGLALIAISIGADLIGLGGESGFGGKQFLLLLTGILVILIGVGVSSSRGQRYVYRWIAPGDEDTQPLQYSSRQEIIHKSLIIAMWFGIVTGLIESSYRLQEKFVQHKMLYMSQHFVWIIPVTFLCLFMIIGLILITLKIIWPRILTMRTTLFILLIVTFISLYYIKPNIHVLAAITLAIGVSFQLSWFISRRQTLFYELVRATLPWMATIVFAVAAFMIGYIR